MTSPYRQSCSRRKRQCSDDNIVTPQSIEKIREDVRRYNDYFDKVISDVTPKAMPKVEKALIDPLSPSQVKTGTITRYGHRQLDDWDQFHNTR